MYYADKKNLLQILKIKNHENSLILTSSCYSSVHKYTNPFGTSQFDTCNIYFLIAFKVTLELCNSLCFNVYRKPIFTGIQLIGKCDWQINILNFNRKRALYSTTLNFHISYVDSYLGRKVVWLKPDYLCKACR